MTRRAPTLALLLALLLGALSPTAVGAADLPVPSSMAAVGDSITQAASSAGVLGADAPQNSWSTGTSTTVNSHFMRLRALNPQLAAHNRSVSGAKVADLIAQMQTVVALEPDPGYLTVLIGGNDLCTDTVAQMTSVADFRARLTAAMDTITTQSPGTAVYVVSIPDVYQLWNLFKGNFFARFVWSSADICQSLLANPTSTQQADVERRAMVRQRNIDFNLQLGQVCALYTQCRFDGNAVFNTPFTTGDVSGDYFHPSVAGQTKLASVSWAAGYTWAPKAMWVGDLAESASAARNAWSASVTITVTDGAPVSGVMVTGSWSAGSGATSCTTTSAGSCTVTVSLGKKTSTTTYAVTGLARSGWQYRPGSNAETSITVAKP